MYSMIMSKFFTNILILIVELGLWMSLWNISDIVIEWVFPSVIHKFISYIVITILCVIFYYILTK